LESEFRDGVCTPRIDKDTLWQTEVGLSGNLDSSALDARDANAQQPIAHDGYISRNAFKQHPSTKLIPEAPLLRLHDDNNDFLC
jgi:hypothetical protein